jgi:Rps23 Pro-64 3,4-dihydroxylase Tpa1-like proline 4-hydroxylase
MPSNQLKDYILVLDDILPTSLCDDIINEYKQDNDWAPATVGFENKHAPSVRDVDSIGVSLPEIILKNHITRKKLDNGILLGASKAISLYSKSFEYCKIVEDSGYDLLRYETGQFYKQHVDSFKDRPRAVSCSFALNDDYEGGEFGFFDRELVVKAPKGGVVLFPSNFMYPHEILPVTSGTRYSIITWFI